jgi:ABC-type phosphate transport system substrate-binding protein
MKPWRLLLALVWVAAAAGTCPAKQLAIVADNANSTTNLTSVELVKIFKAHTRTWPDGEPITIVLRDPSSADMQLILRKVFNMTADEAHAFIHAHEGTIVIVDSDAAVQRSVANIRGAIGVIDLYSLTKYVRVLKIDGKLPVEQGYLLRRN